MYKPFYKTGWKNDKSTPITDESLNHYDDALAKAYQLIADLKKQVDALTAKQANKGIQTLGGEAKKVEKPKKG